MPRRHRLLGLLAIAALTVAILPVAAFGDGPVAPETFEVTEPAGEIRLTTTDNSISIELFDEDGFVVGGPVGQTLEKKEKCVVSEALSGVLGIDVVDAASGFAIEGLGLGLVSGGLGSTDGKNCNTSNGRVEQGQALKLSLPSSLGDGIRADYADLDIEGKFAADLLAEGELDGESTLTTDPAAPLLLADAGDSDNGADAGSADNTYLRVGTTAPGDDFDVLMLQPTSLDERGEISLEGGADWDVDAGTRTSIIHLAKVVDTYEYTLGCGDYLFEEFNAANADVIDAPLSAEVERYDAFGGKDDSQTCFPIGAEVEATANGGIIVDNTFLDASGNVQTPNLRLTLTWRVALDSGDRAIDGEGGVWDELQREVYFGPIGDDFSPETAETVPVQYCVTDNDTTGGPQPADQPTDGDGNDRNWCLLYETVDVVDGYLIQTQVYDGAGDPYWR